MINKDKLCGTVTNNADMEEDIGITYQMSDLLNDLPGPIADKIKEKTVIVDELFKIVTAAMKDVMLQKASQGMVNGSKDVFCILSAFILTFSHQLLANSFQELEATQESKLSLLDKYRHSMMGILKHIENKLLNENE